MKMEILFVAKFHDKCCCVCGHVCDLQNEKGIRPNSNVSLPAIMQNLNLIQNLSEVAGVWGHPQLTRFVNFSNNLTISLNMFHYQS